MAFFSDERRAKPGKNDGPSRRFVGNFHKLYCYQHIDMKTASTVLLLSLCQIAVAQITVTPDVFEFGVVKEHQRPIGTATLANTGKTTVTVTKLMRTCVCSDAKIDKQEIKPGESAKVSFWLNPNDLVYGPFYKTFYARTDSTNQPAVMMAMRGEVVPMWRIEPGRRIDLGSKGVTAEYKLRPSPEALAITGISVVGEGTNLVASLTTNEVDKTLSVKFTPPRDLSAGYHYWELHLNLAGENAKPLILKVSNETGTTWVTSPRMIRLPTKADKPFSTLIYLKPTHFDGLQDPVIAAIDPATISVSPKWDGVTFTPEGKSNRHGFIFRMTIPVEMIEIWDTPETFFFTIPGSGGAGSSTASPTRNIAVQGTTVTRSEARQAADGASKDASAKPTTLEVFTQEGCDDCEWVQRVFLPRVAANYESNLNVRVSYTSDKKVFIRLLDLLERNGVHVNASVYVVVNESTVLSGRGDIVKRAFPVIDAALYGLGAISPEVGGASPVCGTDPKGCSRRGSEPDSAGEPDGNAAPAVASRFFARFSVLTVALAGLADGFNPCAFATAIFLTSLLALGGRSRRVKLLGGLAFCIASFLTYFLLGFGFLRAFRALDGLHAVRLIITYATSALLFVLAALSMVDAVRYNRKGVPSSVLLQLPNAVKQRIHNLARVCLSGPTVLVGGLLCGAGVTLLESVCTGQLYLPILVWLSRESGGVRAWMLLLLYNVAFILPLLVVFLLAAYGVHNQRLADWSRRHVVPAKILLAVVFLTLAFLLLR